MKNNYRLFGFILVLALVTSVPAAATPTTIHLDDGWHEFFFHGTSDYSDWLDSSLLNPISFQFSLSVPATLIITDAFFPGDVFKVYNNGVLLGPSNKVSASLHIWTDDPDIAYIYFWWSHFTLGLAAGDYLVTGTAESFVPYIGKVGAGFLQVTTTPPGAPLPPSGLLMVSGLLGLAGWRRLAQK